MIGNNFEVGEEITFEVHTVSNSSRVRLAVEHVKEDTVYINTHDSKVTRDMLSLKSVVSAIKNINDKSMRIWRNLRIYEDVVDGKECIAIECKNSGVDYDRKSNQMTNIMFKNTGDLLSMTIHEINKTFCVVSSTHKIKIGRKLGITLNTPEDCIATCGVITEIHDNKVYETIVIHNYKIEFCEELKRVDEVNKFIECGDYLLSVEI